MPIRIFVEFESQRTLKTLARDIAALLRRYDRSDLVREKRTYFVSLLSSGPNMST